MKTILLACVLVLLALFGMRPGTAQDQKAPMSFFVTSEGPGNGANLGGLKGADAYCQKLAQAVGAGDRTWHAYLSTSAEDGKPAVNARDRIGKGPWYNAKGVKIADDVANLHMESVNINKETALDEKGNRVNARGDKPNKHDILHGSQLDGRPIRQARTWLVGIGPPAIPPLCRGRLRSATTTARAKHPGYRPETQRMLHAAVVRMT